MRIRSIGTRLTFWYTSLLTLTFLLLAGCAEQAGTGKPRVTASIFPLYEFARANS